MTAERDLGDSRREIPGFAVSEVLIAGNRGPCGGVNMALEAAEQVLELRDQYAGFKVLSERLEDIDPKFRIYTNWDVVNNRPIMAELRNRGFISVKNDWSKAPNGSVVFFSAHGVPPDFHRIAAEKNYDVVDTTCQLVTKVHNLALKAQRLGQHVVYIGVKGHPETEGVVGELLPENITVVENDEDVDKLDLGSGENCITYNQTTLMPDDVTTIQQKLAKKFPDMEITSFTSLCYATTNRQAALEELIRESLDLVLVVGSPESHNSQMLRKKGERNNIPSYAIDYPSEILAEWFNPSIRRIGMTSGASVQERFLDPVSEWFRDRGAKIIEQPPVQDETKYGTFALPREDINRLRSRWQL